jgi:hypothetical protein
LIYILISPTHTHTHTQSGDEPHPLHLQSLPCVAVVLTLDAAQLASLQTHSVLRDPLRAARFHAEWARVVGGAAWSLGGVVAACNWGAVTVVWGPPFGRMCRFDVV